MKQIDQDREEVLGIGVAELPPERFVVGYRLIELLEETGDVGVVFGKCNNHDSVEPWIGDELGGNFLAEDSPNSVVLGAWLLRCFRRGLL